MPGAWRPGRSRPGGRPATSEELKEVRARLLAELGIALVLDVGANAGQYATALRGDGYAGRIISFEPILEAHSRLEAIAAGDAGWETRRLALGARSGRATLNVSANSYSSSILPLDERCEAAAPEAVYVRTEEVELRPLDTIGLPAGPILLKIDVQGYEPEVLRGATALLSRVALVELELSLVPLYRGQALAPQVCEELRAHGFVPIAFGLAFADPETGEILQLDGLFQRVPGSRVELTTADHAPVGQ